MSDAQATMINDIAAEISGCTNCPLHEGRTQTVPGDGNPNASIIFIGEAPGAREDEQGVPFVGRSGQYLNYLLDQIGLKRPDVFITNVVKCRPPSNRDPQPHEIDACDDYLTRQIETINPEVIVTVGRFSMARYFPNAKISNIHGQPKYEHNRAYFPIYHPAAALRNPGLRRDMETDFKKLLDVIEEVKRRRASDDDFNAEPNDDPADEPPQQLTLL